MVPDYLDEKISFKKIILRGEKREQPWNKQIKVYLKVSRP